MHVLKIVSSPRKEKSAYTAIVDAFLSEYKQRAEHLFVDTLLTSRQLRRQSVCTSPRSHVS